MLTMRNDPASPLALTFKPIAAAVAPEPVSGCPGAPTADATFPASSATEPSASPPPMVAAAKTGALRENVPRRVAAARPSAPAAQGSAASAAPVAIPVLRRSKSPRGVAKAVPARSAVLSQESVG